MSLRDIIAAYDDTALEALASKGLLRRAHKDMAAGRAEIVRFDADAEVMADGQTVTIPETGPARAACTCSANGICRHIVLALLALRGEAVSDGAAGDAPPPSDTVAEAGAPPAPVELARDMLVALTEAELRKLTGGDWDQAHILAATARVEAIDHGVAVAFGAPEARVVFVDGQPARDAIYKGPKTRLRLVRAAAAIAVRDGAGVARSEGAGVAAGTLIDAKMCGDVRRTLLAALDQVFRSNPMLAAERLMDLAISARAQAAPRLTGQLMTLSTQAEWAASRDIRFDGRAFLVGLARAYALVEGIEANPVSPVLLGTIRRSYHPADPVTLWAPGADEWHTPSGARGLTAYYLDPETGRFFTTVEARAGGYDPSFTPAKAYGATLWRVTSVSGAMGQIIRLERPAVSDDGQIALGQDPVARLLRPISVADIQDCPARIDCWANLPDAVQAQSGRGLQHAGRPIALLLGPTAIAGEYFDDINQLYRWPIRDAVGDFIDLSVQPDTAPAMAQLAGQQTHLQGLLVLCRSGLDGPTYVPVSAMVMEKDSLACRNLHFDALPKAGWVTRSRARLRQAATRRPAPITRESGKWKGRSKIGGGRRGVRNALYMPALVAIRHNLHLAETYRKLVDAGKPAKLAIAAIMRKLVILANALVRDDRKWTETAP
ncbi:MAG: transposase [Rhodobacteraceae bacterium]|nr:transposase [Paracoccaceae bacterium]